MYKTEQAYIDLKNKNNSGLKRLDALIHILKHNFGKEVIYFASDIDKVRKELSKCLSELLNIRNEYFANVTEEREDYEIVKAIILNKDDTSDEEVEKYVEIIRHLGYGVLEYGADILKSDIIILTEYESIQNGYWFTYQNIDDFANYIEDVLSIIKKECNDIDDTDFICVINKKINNAINKYWMNTVEFDYAEFENENNL